MHVHTLNTLENERIRQLLAHLFRHLLCTLLHSLQNLGSVQELAAHHEPEFIFLLAHAIPSSEIFHGGFLCRQAFFIPFKKSVETLNVFFLGCKRGNNGVREDLIF